MPKDYQVSQYDAPINVNGWLELPDGSRVRIERAHMEEDTGKTSHIGGGGRIHDADHALVDYNRAGVPLVEIVSAPDIRSSAQARLYASELRGILVATGASDGRMEEGSMRVDANVSVRRAGTFELGTRCEIKNLNSLAVARAGHRVRDRAADRLARGRRQGRATDAALERGPGRHRRPPLQRRGVRLPVLSRARPRARRPRRRVAVRGGRVDRSHAGRSAAPSWPRCSGPSRSPGRRADQIATVVEHGLDGLVLARRRRRASTSALALARTANEASADPEAARRLDVAALRGALRMEQDGKLSATQAKAVLADMLEHGGDPAEIARRRGFEALDAGSLEQAVAEVVAAHPDEWRRYTEGEDKLVGFFIGAGHEGDQRPRRRQGRGRRAPPPARLNHFRGAPAPGRAWLPGACAAGAWGPLREIPTPRRTPLGVAPSGRGVGSSPEPPPSTLYPRSHATPSAIPARISAAEIANDQGGNCHSPVPPARARSFLGG